MMMTMTRMMMTSQEANETTLTATSEVRSNGSEPRQWKMQVPCRDVDPGSCNDQ